MHRSDRIQNDNRTVAFVESYWVSSGGEPPTWEMIRTHVGLSPSGADKVLARLVAAGRLVKPRRGFWLPVGIRTDGQTLTYTRPQKLTDPSEGSED